MPDPLVIPAASRSGGSPPALRVEGLRKTCEDGFTAVAGLDLEIPDGAFLGQGDVGAGRALAVVWALVAALTVRSAAMFATGRLKP